MFHNNLEEVMKRCPSLDEPGATTVQKTKWVISSNGSKQLNKVTSGEPGTFMTTYCAVSATGNNDLHSVIIFPS